MKLENIKNPSLKNLAKKVSRFSHFYNAPHDLGKQFFDELKFAKLIVPAYDVDETGFYIEFPECGEDCYNFGVFTDLDAYNKVYGGDENFQPQIFEVINFSRTIYSNIIYFEVNGKYRIPMDVVRSEVSDEWVNWKFVNKKSHHYTLEDTQKLIASHDNEELIEYIDERKFIQSYLSLFDVIGDSVLFCEVLIKEDNDDDVILKEDVTSSLNLVNGYVTLFCNLKDIKTKHYSVVDMLNMIHYVIYDNFKGIKLDNGNKQVTLSRKLLLKNYDNLMRYEYRQNRTDALNYIFKIKGF